MNFKTNHGKIFKLFQNFIIFFTTFELNTNLKHLKTVIYINLNKNIFKTIKRKKNI